MTVKKIFFALFAIGLFAATPAKAETAVPQWTVSSVSRPTNFKPDSGGAGEDTYVVLVTNTGGAASAGAVVVTDELPAGLTPAAVGASGEATLGGQTSVAPYREAPRSMECGLRSCAYAGPVAPGETLAVTFPVRVTVSEARLTNVVRVGGGGAPTASMQTPTTISSERAGFGVAPGSATTSLSSVQAGAHPDLTVTGAFDTETASGETAGNLKNIVTYTPPGFALDLLAAPTCPDTLFLAEDCPVATQVGVTTAIVAIEGNGPTTKLEPVYNLTSDAGNVAKIGFFTAEGEPHEGDIALRAPGEAGAYGGKTTFSNTTADIADVDGFSLTLWGVPANPIHDPLRTRWVSDGIGELGASSTATEAPYFTNPTVCTAEPLQTEFEVTSWLHPSTSESPPRTKMPFGPLVGCDRLALEPSLSAEVTSNAAYSPTGFDLDTKIKQTYPNPEVLAASTLQREVVSLPEGLTLNPSSGVGLQACSESQYSEETAPEPTGQAKEAGHGCPNSSKLATVKIKTPLLEEEAKGSVFLAEPAVRGPNLEAGRNPFNALLALYLIARIPTRGVLVKVPGLVELNPATGQITTTFGAPNAFEPAGDELEGGLPPLPFGLATFEFNQGANAPLVTPPACGDYTATVALTPWADPLASPLEPALAPFPITTGVGGGACPAAGIPFNPQIAAGTENPNAGSYSALELKISRQDGEQEITGFATALPPGLTGNLSGIPYCGEAEIAHARAQTGVEAETGPACPSGSEIGYSVADAGVGTLLAQAPGKLYLGGPYDNAPFSVVSITAAHVGPFDLGTVVIHFPLDINPETADVTIPASPSDVIPHIIKGIVIHVREIRAYVNRQSFMLNPTNCEPFNFSATVIGGGAGGGGLDTPAGYDPVTVTDPFRVTACQALKFKPKLAVSTRGKTSKADGASLTYKLTYPTNALTNDANIKYVKVTLPKALPSRLTTLQRACLAKEFAANPASCPPESAIGHAHAVVPNLPVPLEGPVYFVSHGGEAFPSLEVVLRGDGVTVILVGATYISPQGVTSTTFHAIPDNPVTSFEITLPQGKFSALGTNKNLCDLTTTKTVKTKVDKRVKGKLVRKNGKLVKVVKKTTKTVKEPLVMGNEYIGQNGATYNANVALTVTGCPKSHTAKKAHKKKGHRKK